MSERAASVLAVEGNRQSDPLDDLPVAYVEVDSHGVIVRANLRTRAQHSSHVGALLGRHVWDMLPADQQELSRTSFLAAMQAGVEPPLVLRSVFTKAGSYRVHELHRNLIRDVSGRPVGMRVVSLDITERHTAEEEARRGRAWLESALASMADAVILTDALGFIRTANPAVEETFGWKPEELQGKIIEQALPVLSYCARDAAEPTGYRVDIHKRQRGLATILDRQRRAVRVEIGAAPILDQEHGGTLGVVHVLRRVDGPI